MYFLTPHSDEDLIISWASEWSNYCAITFVKTTNVTESDIRVAFNDGMDILSVDILISVRRVRVCMLSYVKVGDVLSIIHIIIIIYNYCVGMTFSHTNL